MLLLDLRKNLYIDLAIDRETISNTQIINFVNQENKPFKSFDEMVNKSSTKDKPNTVSIFPLNNDMTVLRNLNVPIEAEFKVPLANTKPKLELTLSKELSYYMQDIVFSSVDVAFTTFDSNGRIKETKLYHMTRKNNNPTYVCNFDSFLAKVKPEAITIIISISNDTKTLYKPTEENFLKQGGAYYTFDISNNDTNNIAYYSIYERPASANIINATNQKAANNILYHVKALTSCKNGKCFHINDKLFNCVAGSKYDIVDKSTSLIERSVNFVPNSIYSEGISVFFNFDDEDDIIISLEHSQLGVNKDLKFLDTATLAIYSTDYSSLSREFLFNKLERIEDSDEVRVYFSCFGKETAKFLKFLANRPIVIDLMFDFVDLEN